MSDILILMGRTEACNQTGRGIPCSSYDRAADESSWAAMLEPFMSAREASPHPGGARRQRRSRRSFRARLTKLRRLSTRIKVELPTLAYSISPVRMSS